jgi:hypothetical protein
MPAAQAFHVELEEAQGGTGEVGRGEVRGPGAERNPLGLEHRTKELPIASSSRRRGARSGSC